MIQLSYVTSLPYENEISEHEICIFTRINISMVKLNFTSAAVCLLRSETLKIAFHIERRVICLLNLIFTILIGRRSTEYIREWIYASIYVFCKY